MAPPHFARHLAAYMYGSPAPDASSMMHFYPPGTNNAFEAGLQAHSNNAHPQQPYAAYRAPTTLYASENPSSEAVTAAAMGYPAAVVVGGYGMYEQQPQAQPLPQQAGPIAGLGIGGYDDQLAGPAPVGR